MGIESERSRMDQSKARDLETVRDGGGRWCSPGDTIRMKGRKGSARNGGWKSGSETSERSSTNHKRGICGPREVTWQDVERNTRVDE